MSPFEIADNIFLKQGRLDAVEAGYDIWMMNKIAANNKDTVFFADAVNRFPSLTRQMSYVFYYEGVDKGKRFGKWYKSTKDDDVALLCNAYNVNKCRAAQYLKVIGQEGMAVVRAEMDKGGKGASKKVTGRAKK